MAINKTRLHKKHIEHNAKMVDFSGWNMPINYGSQINEHNAVRSHVGIFDVSHMTVFDLSGSEQVNFLRKLLPNNVDKIKYATSNNDRKVVCKQRIHRWM